MVKRVLGVAVLFAAVSISAASTSCGDSGTDGPVDCSTITVKGYSELGAAFSKCTTCHSSELTTPTERQSAPADFDYNTAELAAQFPVEIREQVEDDEMPPAGSPTLTAQEKTDLLNWADCGTPP